MEDESLTIFVLQSFGFKLYAFEVPIYVHVSAVGSLRTNSSEKFKIILYTDDEKKFESLRITISIPRLAINQIIRFNILTE